MKLRVRDERGTMLPLAIVAALLLFTVLAFSIDQGIAYAMKVRQENALDSARLACMDASFALRAKNAEDPGREVANLVVRTIRDEGCAARVTVWFYEAPPAVLPYSERLWAIGIQLEDDAPTVFARGYGVMDLPVASHKVLVALPYAGERAWRPQECVGGRYEAGKGSAGVAFHPLDSLDEYPNEVNEALQAALPKGHN